MRCEKPCVTIDKHRLELFCLAIHISKMFEMLQQNGIKDCLNDVPVEKCMFCSNIHKLSFLMTWNWSL